jgi:hypothetical protein
MYVLTHCLQAEKIHRKQRKKCGFCRLEFLKKLNGNPPIEDHDDVPLDETKRIGGIDLPGAVENKLITGSQSKAPLLTIHHRASATRAKFFASPNCKPLGHSMM